MKTETRVLSRHKDDDGNIYKIFHITHFNNEYSQFSVYWTREEMPDGTFVHRTRRMVINKHSEFYHVTQRLYQDNNVLGDGTYTVMLRE